MRKWWPSAEHYFQAGKFSDPELQEQVRRAPEPGIAKHLGRTLGPLRADWDDVKANRLRRALREKLWAHVEPRNVLLSIVDGAHILYGNTVDSFFGTGPDGNGLNVMGTELERWREFFQRYSQRLEVPVTVAEVGDPFEPQSTYVDLTGARPDEVPELLAEVLGVHQASITDVAFLYDDGFERMDLSDMESAESLQAFLVSNTRDCKMEARFSEMAVVTLWNATDDGYLGRAEVGTLIRTAPEVKHRLESLLPILQHSSFRPDFSYSLDGAAAKLDEASMAKICQAARDGVDVLINGHYEVPDLSLARAVPAADPPTVCVGVHTDLSTAELRDKIQGLLWGCALGDAVGLSTEFMDKAEAARSYPAQLSPASRVEDRHRKRWVQGDWTDDTDQMVTLLDAIVAGSGVLQEATFAKGLKAWLRSGFPELGDSSGLGIGQTVKSVLENAAFDVAPSVAADVVWRETGCSLAANGAIMRCAAAALGCFWDEAVVRHNAVVSAAVTHADPRCLTSCVCIALILARLLAGHSTATLEQRRQLVLSVALQASEHLDGGDVDELLRYVDVAVDGLSALELGSGGIGYTYKPLGAAAWSFLHMDDFKTAIQAVSMEAGDADSNAAVAGALLGARLGYQNLPGDWLKELPAVQVSWFSQKIDACLVMLGLD
ncbi:unnamed protein product [Symbiodinium microadriaticum]|nr:unnamed protein product [Symbiodinium microadriaticum]